MGSNAMTVLEAAALLEVSRDTVHRLIRAGELRARRKTTLAPRSAFVIDRASVEAYAARRAQAVVQAA